VGSAVTRRASSQQFMLTAAAAGRLAQLKCNAIELDEKRLASNGNRTALNHDVADPHPSEVNDDQIPHPGGATPPKQPNIGQTATHIKARHNRGGTVAARAPK
jgi:hypothetical protein